MEAIRSKIRHRLAIGIPVLFLALLVGAVAGGKQVTDREGAPEAAVAARPADSSFLSMTTEEAAGLSPMLQEMRRILIRERDQLAVLHAEFAQATDSREALRIQHRIRDLKSGTEIALLEVQAATAREQGRSEDAEQLEGIITRLADREQDRRGDASRE